MLIYLPLTAISARSSSLVSFVFKSTAMPFASRIVLQQLSTLSLINTRLRSNENAILFLSLLLSLVRSIAEWNFHVYTLYELVVTAAACDWLKRTAITCRNFPAIIWKNIGSFTYSGAILNWKSSESYKKKTDILRTIEDLKKLKALFQVELFITALGVVEQRPKQRGQSILHWSPWEQCSWFCLSPLVRWDL